MQHELTILSCTQLLNNFFEVRIEESDPFLYSKKNLLKNTKVYALSLKAFAKEAKVIENDVLALQREILTNLEDCLGRKSYKLCSDKPKFVNSQVKRLYKLAIKKIETVKSEDERRALINELITSLTLHKQVISQTKSIVKFGPSQIIPVSPASILKTPKQSSFPEAFLSWLHLKKENINYSLKIIIISIQLYHPGKL